MMTTTFPLKIAPFWYTQSSKMCTPHSTESVGVAWVCFLWTVIEPKWTVDMQHKSAILEIDHHVVLLCFQLVYDEKTVFVF